MIAADRSKYLQFVLTDPRHCEKNSFYTLTDAQLTLEAEIVKPEEQQPEDRERTHKQSERLPVLEMLHKYGLGEPREHLLLAGKPGSGKSTTLQRLCVELAVIASQDDLHPIPIFVQLKGDKPILTLIQAEFRRAKLKVTDEQIDDLLLEDKLVLLLDGVNEIPSEQLRRELQDFRENNLTTPTIFTTRDLTVGGSLGIDKRLEMRPLTEAQMQDFVRKYLPEYGDKLLGQLRDRLREIAETPLLLKMLCEVFEPQTGRIPQNKAELFELFHEKYQRHKEGVLISADFRRFQSEILQYLAFTMLQGDAQKPTEAWLTLPRDRAEGIIEAWLKRRNETNPASKAKEWLEDLVEHHLLQVAADPQQIEFHHQLFQEYYAARHLRSMLDNKHPDLVDDDRLKHFYLNYLKWTEPLGLLLGLLDDEDQALRLVSLGLEVDWFLGARLAGEVKQEFQPQTVGLVTQLIGKNDFSPWLKISLWRRTQSSTALSKLLPFLNDISPFVRVLAVEAFGRVGNESSITNLLPLLEDSDLMVSNIASQIVTQLSGKHNLSQFSLPAKVSNDRHQRNRKTVQSKIDVDASDLLLQLKEEREPYKVMQLLNKIEDLANQTHVPDLMTLLSDPNQKCRYKIVQIIKNIADASYIPLLESLLEDVDVYLRFWLELTIGKLNNNMNVSRFNDFLDIFIAEKHDSLALDVIDAIFYFGKNQDIRTLLPLLEHENQNISIPTTNGFSLFADQSFLPYFHHKLAESSDHKITRIILAIQAKCEFYNYDIFRIPLTSQRDKIEGNKTDNHFPNATKVQIFEKVDRYYQNPPPDSSS